MVKYFTNVLDDDDENTLLFEETEYARGYSCIMHLSLLKMTCVQKPAVKVLTLCKKQPLI